MNIKIIKTFLITYTLVHVIVVYILKLPNIITGATNLIYEYYYKHWLFNYFFDLIVCSIYLLIANYFIYVFNIINYKFLIVALTSFLISTCFLIYFISYPKTNSFFSRWFHKTKFNAVFYDTIVITLLYIGFNILYNYIK